MLLPDKEGIICDVCTTTYRDDFTYYSYDFRTIKVHQDAMQQIVLKSPPEKSVDVCSGCHENFKKVILKNYKPSPSDQGRIYKSGIYCDLSGAQMKGSYTFKHCNISEAIVAMSHKPYICAGCKKPVKDKNKECPNCQGTDFGKIADVKKTDRAIELWVCEKAYQALIDKVDKNQSKMENNLWTTKPE
jgi:hypothetical protein